MKAAGFSLLRSFGKLNRGLELSFARLGYTVDFFTFYNDVARVDGEEKQVLWNSMWFHDRLLRRMGFPLTEFIYAGNALAIF
jgi:hypothetical protein